MEGERRAGGALLAEGLRVCAPELQGFCASPEIAVTHSPCSVGLILASSPSASQRSGSGPHPRLLCQGTWAEQAGSGE